MSFSPFIQSAMAEASQIARSYFGQVTGTTKAGDNNQVLTEADVAIGSRLIELIQSTYPEHNIIDEEAGVIDRNSEFTWVIDPIDGTSNFASNLPTFTCMLGLLKGETPIAGGVAAPMFDQISVAEKGSGAFTNQHRLHVTSETNLLKTLVGYQIDGHQEDPSRTREEGRILAEIVLGIRNLRASGSTLDYVWVAEGKLGGVLNQTSKIWDNVAPQVILEEAGAVYTTFDGQPLVYHQPLTKVSDNYTVCAANPTLHDQLQQLIKTARSSRMAADL